MSPDRKPLWPQQEQQACFFALTRFLSPSNGSLHFLQKLPLGAAGDVILRLRPIDKVSSVIFMSDTTKLEFLPKFCLISG